MNKQSEQSISAAHYEEFKRLVAQMRKAQKNYYKDRPKVGYKVAYNNMINKEYLVDQWLEENLRSTK